MRTATTLAIMIGLGAAACGNDDNKAKDGGPDPAHDAAIDAPVLPACANPVNGTKISFRELGDVGQGAVLVTAPAGDPRLFVVVQEGLIRLFQDEQLVDKPFLDLSIDNNGPVKSGGEQGLLGLAFHPDYHLNRTFFVYYTTDKPSGLRDVVARCQTSVDPNVAEGCTEILSIPDFAENHNGGMIEFGSDGYLYIGTGDGGGGGDPNRNGQSVMDGDPSPSSVALLGKILRIDVNNKAPGKEYGIPSTNPFASGGGAPEIFIIGVRNPWRWSFDRATGDMYVADVGQDQVEEVTVLKPSEQRGANLGWRMYEGTDCFDPPCSPAGKIMPQFTRRHSAGWASITGGQVYRGTCYPDLVGKYFFADYVGNKYARGTFTGTTLEVEELQGQFPGGPSSLHADARGELHLTNTDGRVYRLEASP